MYVCMYVCQFLMSSSVQLTELATRIVSYRHVVTNQVYDSRFVLHKCT